MARKKEYLGGFRLTLATARKLAVQEFGTAKGLEPDRGTYLEGFFTMRMGNMGISISPDLGMSGCIVVRAGLCTASHTCVGYFNRETLVSTPFKNVIFRRNRMSFFAGQHTGVYSLNYRPTCRLEARQVLIYQCILDLTGENGKYNYSKAAHLYPPLSYSPCSAKNYKIASALTAGAGL